jgi:YHS domain-containing protein
MKRNTTSPAISTAIATLTIMGMFVPQVRAADEAPPLASPAVSVALDGYCAVCIIEARKWMKGNPAHEVVYDGQAYRFPSADQAHMFADNPAKYVPVLGGDCTVCYAKAGKRIAGDIHHAAFYKKRLYLFPSDKERAVFHTDPRAFANADLAMDGNCVVCQVEANKQMPGSEEFVAHHDGLRYLFPGAKQRDMFIANPNKYAVRAAQTATKASARTASAGLIVIAGESTCAACEHGVHPLGNREALGLAINGRDGQVYVIEDADQRYPKIYEDRFDSLQLKVVGKVVRSDGRINWVEPESLEIVREQGS